MQIKFPTVEDVKEDEAFVDKVLKFKWPLAAGAAFFVAVAVFISGGGSRKMARERDFFSISKIFGELVDQSDAVDHSQLAKFLKSYPEITSDFDYILRDKKILQGDDVTDIEDRMIARLSYLHPFYLEHMAIVQLIVKKDYVIANQRAISLVDKIEKAGVTKFPKLYCFVLARYGFLQGKLGNSDSLKENHIRVQELIYGDPSILGQKAQIEMQEYMQSDELFFTKYFE